MDKVAGRPNNAASVSLAQKQKVAVEYIATNPGTTNEQLAKILQVDRKTVGRWRSNAKFIEMVYDRFMEITGVELPNVINALVREACEGNVKAAELVLKHFGKFQDVVHHKVKIEAPFMQHLRQHELDDVEDAEIVIDSPLDVFESYELTEEDKQLLPERNLYANKRVRKQYEEKKVDKIIEKDKPKPQSEVKKQNKLSTYYFIRKRADRVGLKPLPKGKSPKNVRDKWLEELFRLENEHGVRYK